MLIIIASQFIIRSSESEYTRLVNNWINVAGRNRTLSVKVLNLSQQVANGQESQRKSLNKTKEEIEFALRILRNGGKIFVNKKELQLPTIESNLLPSYKDLMNAWNKYNQQVSQISSNLYTQYNDGQKKQITNEVYRLDDQFIKTSDEIIEQMGEVSQNASDTRMFWQRIILLSNVFILIIVIYVFWQFTLKPLQKLSTASSKIAMGDLEAIVDIDQKDEIGKIAGATNDLANNLKEVKAFVNQLGEGNYEVQLDIERKGRTIAKDGLFTTLVNARDRLRNVMSENEKQSWVSNGLAELSHTLSAGNLDVASLSKQLLSQLILYIGGNQGAIFLLTKNKNQEQYLELASCYGFDEERLKHRKLKFDDEFGSGLIGQALVEKGTIHQVGVVPEYFDVTFATGDVKNGNVLIVPLIFNQMEVGVLELGSFSEFANHEIDFIETLADRIASTILNIQSNNQTNLLLKESEEQKEVLQAQEEEMRQNVEELRSIHEVMEAKQKELELQNRRIKSSEQVLTKALKQLEEQKKALETQKIELEETNDILHAQEEEMRQNVEELIATQETLALKSKNLERQNKLITTSIHYAKNIQQAILPSPEKLLSLLKNGFVIYRPKDIVSGDFYWLSKVKGKIIVAAVDCTGHGVPGAFMSMIGNTLLNQIVNEKKLTNPAEILSLLDKSVYEGLNQQKSSNREGMDVSLCTIELKESKYQVLYAGAKRSLYYITKGELQEEKGARFSIGGWQANSKKEFTASELMLEVGDRLYLSSDGFVDTPSPNRKSFGTKRFRQALQKSATLPMKEQQEFMSNTLDKFQKTAEQRDDILLVGVEL